MVSFARNKSANPTVAREMRCSYASLALGSGLARGPARRLLRAQRCQHEERLEDTVRHRDAERLGRRDPVPPLRRARSSSPVRLPLAGPVPPRRSARRCSCSVCAAFGTSPLRSSRAASSCARVSLMSCCGSNPSPRQPVRSSCSRRANRRWPTTRTSAASSTTWVPWRSTMHTPSATRESSGGRSPSSGPSAMRSGTSSAANNASITEQVVSSWSLPPCVIETLRNRQPRAGSIALALRWAATAALQTSPVWQRLLGERPEPGWVTHELDAAANALGLAPAAIDELRRQTAARCEMLRRLVG